MIGQHDTIMKHLRTDMTCCHHDDLGVLAHTNTVNEGNVILISHSKASLEVGVGGITRCQCLQELLSFVEPEVQQWSAGHAHLPIAGALHQPCPALLQPQQARLLQ